MDETCGRRFVADLSARLRSASGVGQLLDATAPLDPGASRSLMPDTIRIGGRLLRSPLPRVEITLDPPIDARWLSDVWSINRPVAVTGDVHQSSWHLAVASADSTDDGGVQQLVVREPDAGRWQLRCTLTSRPAGSLPRAVAGGGPAYDVRETGGLVRRISVVAEPHWVEAVRSDHPHATQLTSSMAERWPQARPGWRLAPDDQFVVVHDRDGRPVAGAALGASHDGVLIARCLSATADASATHAGSALLDALEAVALDRGVDVLRLDGSTFFISDAVPYDRHGYQMMPPYDGDADATVWAERIIVPLTVP